MDVLITSAFSQVFSSCTKKIVEIQSYQGRKIKNKIVIYCHFVLAFAIKSLRKVQQIAKSKLKIKQNYK